MHNFGKLKKKFSETPTNDYFRSIAILAAVYGIAINICFAELLSITPDKTAHLGMFFVFRLFLIIGAIPIMYEVYKEDDEEEHPPERPYLFYLIDTEKFKAFNTYYFLMACLLPFDPTMIRYLPWKTSPFTTAYLYPTRLVFLYCNIVQALFCVLMIALCGAVGGTSAEMISNLILYLALIIHVAYNLFTFLTHPVPTSLELPTQEEDGINTMSPGLAGEKKKKSTKGTEVLEYAMTPLHDIRDSEEA